MLRAKYFCVITGATGGIGLALAKEFASHQHNLFLIARNEEKLKELSLQFTSEYKISCDFIAADLSQIDEIDRIWQYMSQKGMNTNILINNAGFGLSGKFCEIELGKQLEMINLNITSLVKMTHFFARQFKAQKAGKIMNVASTAAFIPGPNMAVYYASKAFVLNFSTAINKEMEGTGVHISCLCPGPTKTNFRQQAGITDNSLFKYVPTQTAEEVAREAYEGLKKNRDVIITGVSNKATAGLVSFLPRRLILESVNLIQSTTEDKS